ncbi:hypothetical protein [Roseateles terrae]|uniref:Uncharacterized protein n=1 Tax=Roseateles terrae TaxID=431060 RepID=A0ABR6GXD4_9BURK|nr:hypothetical protein [Roseateles terrae]MBB3196758.1 hypothetical protein [Roseateles terrae]OWQ84993.1 hypothetical protein CDN98_18290 [Roseateles terrae]
MQPSTGTTVSGSLRVASADHPTTLMVIVAGSGGTDRDGNAYGATSGSNNLRQSPRWCRMNAGCPDRAVAPGLPSRDAGEASDVSRNVC